MALNTVFSWIIKKRVHQIDLFRKFPLECQYDTLKSLIQSAERTEFGLEHNFASIKTVEDFKKAVPIRNYDEIKPYIDKVLEGNQNILWPSETKWFAKSSGTTSGKSKYIPVTREALEESHYKAGKDLLAMYYNNNPDAKLYKGKHLVMGGSSTPINGKTDNYIGDLSAIIIRNLPFWAEIKRTPNKKIALMDNWDKKIEMMARSTMQEDVHILVGVPSWNLVLLKKILEITGKKNIHEVWPNLELFMHGGVNFKPYRTQYDELMGKPMYYIETYNSSEGCFGIQDQLESDELLLMLDYGIYYEFMPMSEYGKENPQTLSLKEVETDTNYALIISTNGGLWRYLIGDTIRFTSTDPFRIQVTGRTKHFINAFGEELIVENADRALTHASEITGANITDYTAGPIYMDDSSGRGGHEWLIEFETAPDNLVTFRVELDNKLKELNSDYEAKRHGDMILGMPIVESLPKETFYHWLKSKNKLGGQNKVPRLSNHRDFIEELKQMITGVS